MSGYYRWPTIHGDTVVFVSEDDLWTVPARGGPARRLTAGRGEASHPALSPDGKLLAFTGREEGHAEVYVMPAEGGEARRVTYLGGESFVVGWRGREIVFASDADQPYIRVLRIHHVSPDGGLPKVRDWGPTSNVAYGPRTVICRGGFDAARWKRYRGGRCGELWIGRDTFKPLIKLDGNVTHPMWLDGRVAFLSDHEGVGNIYSCTPEGKGLKRHTHHEEHYARNPQTDGRRIVYHAGAELWMLDRDARKIPVDLQSPRAQRQRRFVPAVRYLEGLDIHPGGHALALTVRGKTYSMALWEGAVVQHGAPDGVRYQLARWLGDGSGIVTVTDERGENELEIRPAGGVNGKADVLGGLKIGRPIDMVVSPREPKLAIANERFELVLVDLKRKKSRVLDRSRYARMAGMAWSPDGRWIAYGIQRTPHVVGLNIVDAKSGRVHEVTQGVLADVAPSFDPEGKYLYFLSQRDFNPVYDSVTFDLNFPRATRPCLITLRADLPSPFVPVPRPPGEKPPASEKKKKSKKPPPVRIDFGGIGDRVLGFPVPEGRYGQVQGIHGGALFSVFPVEGSLGQDWLPSEPAPKGVLEKYDFAEQKRETVVKGISGFRIAGDRKTLIYRAGARLRALKVGVKPPVDKNGAGRESGWIDLDRVRVSVDPGAEWRQMYHEAWRLMRDHFWTPDMSGVDWKRVRERYRPLVDRVASRSEFSDLIWETQGELGTSHCYEMGGDYRRSPAYRQGFLAADFESVPRGYRIKHIVHGDPWNPSTGSPLAAPGLGVREGDVITAIGGRPLGRDVTPHELLVNCAGQEVLLTIGGRKPRTVCVKALADDRPVRYRAWVEANRREVHARTRGRVGYIHIPDMGPPGYAEFFRAYLAEVDREALLIDARYNRGGHVSQLLLEKLARKRVGYDVQRWGQPEPYPGDSPRGPLVCLTNELAGSDGDIFSHCFKLMKLGPLVGKRTWGGVIGIWPRHLLVDGSVTTQPEFSFWFRDVGWGVENHGTDPDIEVEVAPHDYAAGRDPQLARGIELALSALRTAPAEPPAFTERPNLALPKLKKR